VNAQPTAGVRCAVMRGGTSKGLYFVADDLPLEESERRDLLRRFMGSPDARQIDGLGGAHPLTSKAAVVSRSSRPDADVDYLFYQVMVDQAVVTDAQNCGNILAGVGPFAIRRGLVSVASDGFVDVRIHMINTGSIAVARVEMAGGLVVERGSTSIAGVPGTGSPIRLDFTETEGSSCGALLPTGHVVDVVAGVPVTLIDNGMPVVVVAAASLRITGYETPAELEANADLRATLERVRLAAGPLMNLGDVTSLTVPKLTIVSPPREGGSLCTRTFIPHRCHDAIGVLGAVSVATASLLAGSPAADVATIAPDATIVVEHPTGTFDVVIELSPGESVKVERSGIVRTARLLMDGTVFPSLSPDTESPTDLS
jgi:4-oxalomesaconate tautomerase